MLRYLLKRTLYAIGVLIVVSVLMFLMSAAAPGDLVESHLALDGGLGAYQQRTYTMRQTEYGRASERVDMHLPLFYCAVRPALLPDTLHRILRKDERRTAVHWAHEYGSWPDVQAYRTEVIRTIAFLESADPDSAPGTVSLAAEAEFLLNTTDTGRIAYVLDKLETAFEKDVGISGARIPALREAATQMQSGRPQIFALLPTIHWHGAQNRYHKWISGVFRGDFGRSLIDGRSVGTKISDAVRWTLTINITAILLAFGIAIPLGVAAARRAGKRSDTIISSVLFAFYAMPAFWLAMLCIVFLTTSEYGSWLDWFPTGGVGMVSDRMGLGERLGIRISHLALPVFCILAGSLAYLTRQMRGSMLRELGQDYIRLARAKGLSEDRVVWKHAFRNALFPVITLVGSAFPAAISGSVILEVIFSIPGMGRLLYMSILAQDWPVVYAMVLLAAALTVIGYLVTDLLYRLADPRVQLQKTRT